MTKKNFSSKKLRKFKERKGDFKQNKKNKKQNLTFFLRSNKIHPAKLLAGYPAKSVSGTSLVMSCSDIA